jgi:hypothetical protein
MLHLLAKPEVRRGSFDPPPFVVLLRPAGSVKGRQRVVHLNLFGGTP